jgi:hypothetical protein
LLLDESIRVQEQSSKTLRIQHAHCSKNCVAWNLSPDGVAQVKPRNKKKDAVL